MASLGEATLDTGVDLSGMKRGLGNAKGFAQSWSSGVGNIIKKGITAGLIGIGAAAAGGIAFLGKSVLEAGDYFETLSKAEVTFGENTDALTGDLGTFAQQVGRSSTQLVTMATDQGAVLKALGATDLQAAQMSGTMARLATDVGSFNNLPMDDVAHRFTRALSGEFESLKALGVVINENILKNELLKMGYDGVTSAADPMLRAQAVMNILLDQTADSQGDAARTSDSFANQMVALKSALTDARVEIGTALLPVILPLVQKFTAWAREILPDLIARFKNEFIPALQSAGAWVSTVLLPALTDLWTQIKTYLMPVIQTIATWLGEKLPIAIAFVREHIDEFKGALIAIGLVLGGVTVLGAIISIIAAIGSLLTPIGAVIAIAALLGAAWAGNWGGIREKTAAARDFIVAAFNFIKDRLQFFFDQWKLIFEAFKKAFSGDWRGFGETLRKVWNNAWEKIKEIGSKAWDAIKSFFGDTDWGSVGDGILRGIANGITSGLKIIKDAAIAAAKAAIEAAKGFLGIDSPSKLAYEEIGYPTGEGQALGWEAGLADTFRAAASIDVPAAAPAAAGGGVTEMHLHVGTLIADDSGLRQLELTLEKFRQTEAERRGLES